MLSFFTGNNVFSKLKDYSLAVFVLSFCLISLGIKLNKHYNFFENAIFFNQILKLVFFGYLFFNIGLNNKNRLLIFLIGLLGVLFFLEDFSHLYISNRVKILIKFFTFFLVTYIFIKEDPIINKQLKIAINVLFFIAFVNSLFVFFGAIFKIELFKSYGKLARFGYNGIFSSAGEASVFYISLLGYELKKLKESKGNLISFLFFLATAFLIGSKSVYLFIAIAFTLLGYIYINKKTYITLLSSLVILFLFFNKLVINTYYNLVGLSVFVKNQDVTNFTRIMSYRNTLSEKAFNYIQLNWGVKNYLLGGEGFISIKRTEIVLFDVFLVSGIVGLVLSLLFILKFYITKNEFSNWVLISQFFVINLIGNFFFSVNNSLFFAVFFLAALKFSKQRFLNLNNYIKY